MFNKRLKAVAIALAGLLVFACTPPDAKNAANTNAANPNTATKVDTAKTVTEVQELLAAHDKALNDQNLDGVVATFSNDPKTVVLGTGQGERFLGTEAIRNAYTEIFKDYEKGTFTAKCDWKEGGVDDGGKMAWMAATCQSKDSMKGKDREYVLNVSAAVVKEATGWKFIMLHMSNATAPGPPADGKKDPGPPPPANAAKPANVNK